MTECKDCFEPLCDECGLHMNDCACCDHSELDHTTCADCGADRTEHLAARAEMVAEGDR